MDAAKRKAFEGLQALARSSGVGPDCKVCAAPTKLFDAVDFNKCCGPVPYQFGLTGIIVPYYRCDSCRFIFTDLIDDWNAAEMSEIIYNADYLKVDPEYLEVRPRRTAMHIAPLLTTCKEARILDYGSGSGVFAAAMGAQGFRHVESYDPFSSPVSPSGTFDLITCFEVLEHAVQPRNTMDEIAERLAGDGVILIGQSLQPDNIEELAGRWWYLAPRNGHVSFFTHETLTVLAGRTRLKYHGGTGLYAFTRSEVGEPMRKVMERIRLGTRREDARQLARARGPRAKWRRTVEWIRRRLAAS